MSEKVKHVLNVAERTANGSAQARRVRAEGLIPAVIYSKGQTAKNLTVKASEWEALQKYEFNMVTLQGKDFSTRALVKEVQKNFIKGVASHIDFLEVRADVAITAVVPLHKGHQAPAGAALGGILEEYVHEIEVECLPDDLPEHIEVDVSAMQIDDSMYVRDIPLPSGVKAKTHGDITIFHLLNPLEIKEDVPEAPAAAAPADGTATAEPEVVGAKEKAERAAEREAEKSKK